MGSDHHLQPADAYIGHPELHGVFRLQHRQAEHAHSGCGGIVRFAISALDFGPGEKMNYSNSGYVVLGDIIEKVSGQSYEQVRHRQHLHAARHEGFRLRLEHRDHQAARQRLPARRLAATSMPATSTCRFRTRPARCIRRRGDLLKWEQALFSGKLVPQAAVDRMITPFKNDYAPRTHVNDCQRAPGDRARRRH